MFDVDPLHIAMVIFALAVAIPIHEFAHAASATVFGDDTPRSQGRLTIFPWDHFDPIGAIFCLVSSIVGFGIGWGKPVLVNPANFKNLRWNSMWVAAWGPISNLILAIGFALPLRYGLIGFEDPLYRLLLICTAVNLGLMLFNLIPIYPLDGSKIASALLPRPLAAGYEQFMMTWGMPIMMLLIIAGGPVLRLLVGIPREKMLLFLLGG